MKEHTKILNEFLRLFDNYQNEVNREDSKVLLDLSPNELKQKFDFSIDRKGISYEALLNAIENYLSLSVKTGHKQFFNQLFGGYNLSSILGEMTTSIANTSMYTYEMSPVATLIELEVIQKMCDHVGYEDGDGILTSGGSLSNLQAMLTARNKYFPGVMEQGTQAFPKMTAFVSEEAHYSLEKAGSILGLGTRQVIKVKTDISGRIIVSELERELEESINNNEKPFFIGLTAGTTLKGAFDSIQEVLPLVKKYNLWLHIDGSWGASVLLSKKHRHLVEGIKEAHSVTWNPHKTMNISVSCSALLVKEKGVLERNYSTDKIDYLFHKNKNETYDLGKKSLQCGRRVDALKLWLSWKYYGDNGYEKRTDKLVELAQYVTEKVQNHPKIELMNIPSFLNICFRWLPNIELDVNPFNLELRESLLKDGLGMVNYGYIDKDLTFRLVLTNPEIDKEDIDTLFSNMEKMAIEISTNHTKKAIAW